GLRDLLKEHEVRIRNGMVAYDLLQKLRNGQDTPEIRAQFDAAKKDLGYGLLLTRYTSDVANATEAQIQLAVKDSIPQVAPLFFSFRIMVGVGFVLLFIIGMAFFQTCRHKIEQKPWLLKLALWGIPLPWIAIEAGWFVAEYGRQPWAVGEILPVTSAASAIGASDVIFSMLLICGLYTLFLIAEMYLMFKFARLGPSSLKTGRYHFEQTRAPVAEDAKA
ncbi:MAG: cytochrome ubiquinol oxidase subunit I, partial [Plesiomonas shigelloides]